MDGVDALARTPLVLSAEGLCKHYPSPHGPKTALDRVSLDVRAGETVCILGPNGSGKSTLLRILSGTVAADAGRVEIGGFDPASGEAKRLVGFCPPEGASFYGRLSALENLRFFAGVRGLRGTRFLERLSFLEEPLGLSEFLPLPFQKLSSGMKRRLALARSLVHDPPLLLLDEPTQSLDPRHSERLSEIVRARPSGGEGRAVLWTTHRPEEAWAVGTRVLVLLKGRALADAAPAELSAGSGSPRAAYERLTRAERP